VQGYVTSANINCFGYGNGTAQAFFSGGTGSLNYSWSNGATTPTIDSLLTGVYFLTVTDSLGCMVIDSIIIFESEYSDLKLGKSVKISPIAIAKLSYSYSPFSGKTNFSPEELNE